MRNQSDERERHVARRAREPHHWADDSRRAWVAVVVSVTVAIAVRLVARWVDFGGGREDDQVEGLATVLTLFIVMLATYLIHTWRVFSRYEPAQLEEAVEATTTFSERSGSPQLARAFHWRWGTGAGSWLVTTAAMSLFVVGALILTERLKASPVLVLGSLLVVALAWMVMAVSGTLMLVRQDLGPKGPGRALQFPDDGGHAWGDYFYLGMQVCTTFSTSDVSVMTTRMREVITSLVATAFVFNTVIVAMLVSVLLSQG